jgi:hypothetical protein
MALIIGADLARPGSDETVRWPVETRTPKEAAWWQLKERLASGCIELDHN